MSTSFSVYPDKISNYGYNSIAFDDYECDMEIDHTFPPIAKILEEKGYTLEYMSENDYKLHKGKPEAYDSFGLTVEEIREILTNIGLTEDLLQ